jgi:L-amino acid N-acyltransferase YncA
MISKFVRLEPDAHAPAVQAIFNDAILNTTALYEYQPRSLDTVVQWFGDKAGRGEPVLGAIDGSGALMGFATWGVFRQRPAYKYTAEHSVYVHRDHRRLGVARQLLRRLIDDAQARELHVLVGGIDATNAESIALHEQLGFRHSGTLTQTGFKFGRWLDLAFYQLILPTPRQPVDG